MLNKIKIFIVKKFDTLYYFYKYIGNKIFILLVFNFLYVLMDGFGLTMFIPLLQIADGNTNTEGANGRLIEYTSALFQFLHLPMNIITMLLLIMLLFSLKALFTYFTMAYQAVNLETFVKKIRVQNTLGLSSLKFSEFVSSDIGRLQNTLTGEANNVVNACRSYIETIKNAMVVFVYLGFAFFMDWKFSLLVVIGGVLSNLIYRFFYKHIENLSRENTKYAHEYSSLVIQSVNNFKYLKATQRNELFNCRMLSVLDLAIDNSIRGGKLLGLTTSIREPIMILVVCAVIGVQLLVFKSSLSAILIILVLFYRAMAYIMSLQISWNTYLASIGSMENMRDFEKYLIQHKEIDTGIINVEKIDEIQLSDLHLSYGDIQVIKGIDLKIVKNKSIAFIGETGSGKTTLVNIIAALLKVDQGAILVNSIPLNEISLQSYRSRIGYISQDTTIFNADIFDNVTFWAERTAENIEQFLNAIKLSSIDKFINGLPNGYNEVLGNNGLNLSGGQKQRISIARELYRDIDILIMDEATSALDSQTEKEIKDSIEYLQGKVTIISIAHRLSTVKNADVIYLLEEGRIVASGNFESLKQKSNYFKNLTVLQGM
ncbi:ATP-binding cassette, subfamily B, MsbA [Flavobacterium glycines]|uniref:ATP-binding cassette, subfamily B, MsbA n=2 Tax=Flavobacterium glycines TaxID=551990 RepID=A0A1B9DH93_9FLAO|nr:ABC transporter ATP-binding protein [Flavobacterium glycines]OCB69092.1 hypothetical protein FBGL_13755 [Flavobacterium glycines]SDJ54514.1 ATP-binding cassette, subfamily B, MsbA [Flavobacterium glycines]